MSDLNCPYCGHDQDVNHDDGFGYDEGKKHEMQCYECDKQEAWNTRADDEAVKAMAAENERMRDALELAAQCQLNRIVKGGDPDIVEVGKKRLAIYEAALKGKNDENK